MELLIFAVVSFATSILSAASGGVGALVTTPLMVALGLTPAQAIATAKFGGFGISLGASGRFYREKTTDKRTVVIFSIMGGVGALAGSLTLAAFQDHTEVLEKLMGLAILLIGVPALYLKNAGLETRPRTRPVKILGVILLGFSVFLQAALGSGSGSLQMVILVMCFGMTALTASATRRAMQLTVATIALAVFILTGLIDYRFAVVSFVSALAGGYIGAHIAIKKGNKFVINIFAAVSGLLAFQLLFG